MNRVRLWSLSAILLLFSAHVAAASEINDAIWANDVAKVRSILEADASVVRSSDESQGTPLHWAVRNKVLTELLLQYGADPNARDGSGVTPLSHGPTPESAALLIKAGATVNTADRDGMSPLHWAAVGDGPTSGELAAVLIKNGAKIEAMDKRGFTPLAVAALYGSDAVAGVLLDNGADIESRDKEGKTPIFHALTRNWTPARVESLNLLLKHGVNVNARAQYDVTPLHDAAGSSYPDTVEWLLGHGAMVNARDKFGHTPLGNVESLRQSSLAGTHDPSKTLRDVIIEHVRRQDEIIALLKRYGATE